MANSHTDLTVMVENTLQAIAAYATALIDAPTLPTRESPALRAIVSELGRLTTADRAFTDTARWLNNQIMGQLELYSTGEETRPNTKRAVKRIIDEARAKLIGDISKISRTGDDPDDLSQDEMMAMLQGFRTAETKLKNGLARTGLYVGTVPILPMTPYSYGALTRHGVSFYNFGGYVVLPTQTVVAISRGYIDGQIQRIEGAAALKPETPAQKKKLAALREEYFADALETALARNRGMSVVGEPSAYEGARLYWIIQPAALRVLRDCSFDHPAATWAVAFQKPQGSAGKMVK